LVAQRNPQQALPYLEKALTLQRVWGANQPEETMKLTQKVKTVLRAIGRSQDADGVF
jgi:hypothetical protein